MCGRFENRLSLEDLSKSLGDDLFKEVLEHVVSNIAPTQKIITLRYDNNKLQVKPMNWGIKFSKDSPLIFNSRIETIKEKSFWKNLFDKNRCVVPMTAFYEWKTDKATGKKIPHRIYLKNNKYFFVPALYFEKEKEFFASLITTTPNSFIAQIHHRMPVIIKPEELINYFTNSYSENLNNCTPYSDIDNMVMERTTL